MAKSVKVVPKDVESVYLFKELFFSKTDLVGNILTGNNVFVRVSQFSKEELIGSPHNIIRHPDMPRVVFKVLWDYLKAGNIIAAYVKNMAKDGRYYWVLAAVYPVDGGYVSIRLKPSSDFFKIIPGVYKKVLAAEESGGMNSSLDLLLSTIQSAGFKDYDAFMSKVLMEELTSRQKMIAQETTKLEFLSSSKQKDVPTKIEDQRALIEQINNVSRHCQTISGIFDLLFKSFENLLNIEQMTNTNTKAVIDFSEFISILSLNASIETHSLGAQGLTLAVISKQIKKYSEEIEMQASTISSEAADISARTQQLGLLLASSRMQADMISFFALESYELSNRGSFSSEDFQQVSKDILLLVQLFVNTFDKVNSILNPLAKRIHRIITVLEIISKMIRDLERTDVLGCIEASRLGDNGNRFNIVFGQMRISTEKTRDKSVEFYKYLHTVIATIEELNSSNADIIAAVGAIETIVQGILKKRPESGSALTLGLQAEAVAA